MISYFPVVTGSLSVSGSVNISGGITASGGISISGSIASSSFASTASFVALAQSASNAVSAATASFANTLTVAGNLTAQTLVVQTITSSVDFVTGSTRFGSIAANTHVFTGSMSVSGSVGVTGALTLNSAGNSIRSGNELRFYRADNGIYTRMYDAGALAANGFILDNTNAEGFHFQNNGTTIIRMNSAGNVGIGTISPTSILDVRGTGTYDFISISNGSTSGGGGILTRQNATASSWFGNSGGWEGGTSNDTGIGSYAGGIRFYTAGGTEKMRITSGGNVGIGITSPGASLAVANTTAGTPSIPSLGSINSYTTAFFSNSNPVYGLLMGSLYNGNTWMQVGRIDGTATAYDLQIQPNGGSVNIGGRLNVGGNVVLSQKLITSFTSNPGNVNNGGTTSFSLTQPTFEYQSTYFVSIIGLYAPSGVNQNGFYTGLVTFFNDSSNAQANVSALHANGWSLSVSATTGGTFSGTFTNTSGGTMSNIWIRILKINKTFDN
jgi:hypothetical protein